MAQTAELLDGLYLSSLDPGSVIEVETKNRCYRIEYLGGDEARISGHPHLCPRPVPVHLRGSIGGSIGSGVIKRGKRLAFQRMDDLHQVTTSEITDIRVVG